VDREEALRLLKGGTEGVAEWNRRREEGEEIPSLKGAVLIGAVLIEADLSDANLFKADLSGTRLSKASLSRANLGRATLAGANLEDADLSLAKLFSANLEDANLSGAVAAGAKLRNANLSRADLSGVHFYNASLIGANLSGTTLTDATFSETAVFSDLSKAVGLDQANHQGPSYVSTDALLGFAENLPEQFFRGCGVDEDTIAYFRSRIGSARYYSVFISYSTDDEKFADKLYNDFQAKGIRCWKWNEDARTGRDLWAEITHAIRDHAKLVLIASKSSLTSPVVIREIKRALAQEDERERRIQKGELQGTSDVLFPVQIDNYVFDGWEHECKVDVTDKVIADACGWEDDPEKYKQVLDRLVRDLRPDE